MNRIGIIGAGAWGTALATVMHRAGRQVVVQCHESEVAEAINLTHENSLYLPGISLDSGIQATTDLADVAETDAVLLVAPAQHLRTICEKIAPAWKAGVPAVICAKGIEQDTCALMSEVVAETLPEARVAVLSGPTFATEVARDLPTAVTLACGDVELAERLMAALGTPHFRIYRSADLIGAQVGGAVKNVLAIACGIVTGRGLGENARAALITRGLAEIVRLGAAKGGHAETLAGLCGLGDITLTCNNMRSRNFSLGVELGRGRTLVEILAARTSVAEGVYTASSVTDLAGRLDVDMPICVAIDGVLHQFADIDSTIAELLARPFKAEAPVSRAAEAAS